MTKPRVYQLLLLGVKETFEIELLNASHFDDELSSVSLLDQCVLTRQDMKALCPSQDATFILQGLTTPLSEKMPRRQPNALVLLLCNNAQALDQASALEWRAYLTNKAHFSYEVIYGQGIEMLDRIRYAWSAALQKWQLQVPADLLRPLASARYKAYCEKCSDPLCESRLFEMQQQSPQCT